MTPAYTHGHAESVLRSHRTRTARNSAGYLLCSLSAGQRLRDVGSGPGTITADLAALVAPGRLVALETSEEILALTRAEVESRGCDNGRSVGRGRVRTRQCAGSCFNRHTWSEACPGQNN